MLTEDLKVGDVENFIVIMTLVFAVPHTVFLPGAAEYQHKASNRRIDSLPAVDLPAAINGGFIALSVKSA